MRYLTTSLLLLWATTLGAMDVWRWVDKDGVVHFSDQPMPGAEKIQLKSAPKTGSVVPAHTFPRSSEASESSPQFRYTRCAISSPAQDEVFQSVDSVSASLELVPGYRAGDRIEVTLNGQRVQDWPEGSTGFQLTGLARGSYSLSAIVLSPDGRTMCTTQPVGFHIRQPSLLTPGRQAAPRS